MKISLTKINIKYVIARKEGFRNKFNGSKYVVGLSKYPNSTEDDLNCIDSNGTRLVKRFDSYEEAIEFILNNSKYSLNNYEILIYEDTLT